MKRPSDCNHCQRAMRANNTKVVDYPGTVEHHGFGLCAACWRHRKTFGTLDGWTPDTTGGGRRADLAQVEERLANYDELRREGLTLMQAAWRMGLKPCTLERFLLRHRADPRTGKTPEPMVQTKPPINHIEPLPVTSETVYAARAVLRLLPDEAPKLLAMLGLVAA